MHADGPEAITRENAMRSINLRGALTLRCDFDGVPIPSVVWVHNSTIELDETANSRITISTDVDGGFSVLSINDVGRDGGGLYTCRFNNSVGVVSINVTTVFILGKDGSSSLNPST